MTHSGIYTTEFWLTVVANVAVILTAVAEVLPPKWAAPTLVVVNGIYVITRAWVKVHQADAGKPPVVVETPKAEVVVEAPKANILVEEKKS